MNRTDRRAAARAKPQGQGVRLGELTFHEAELVAEALTLYRWEMDEPERDGYVAPAERTPLQEWAYERAGTIRDALQAVIEARPWHDTRADREPPTLQA